MVATNSSFIQRDFIWDERRTQAAMMLAQGEAKTAVSEELEIDRVTLYHWLEHPDFAAEVDRLSLMMHISSRAERLRIAMRVARARTQGEVPETEKDLLDWLKFAQSETDGAKIDLSKLAEMLTGESAQQGDGPATRQLQGVIEVDATSGSNEQLQAQGEVVDEETLNPS
jgi:hypothetical protein